MPNQTYQSEVIKLKALNNLFIEMTGKVCNQHCQHCFLEFPKYKKIEDFIDIEIIKQALNDTTQENIDCIYLTGAEPMTHPNFNAILRLCLNRSNTCICTNGSFINEKKARFLKKVEDEFDNEIIFKISIDSFDEIKNDDIRYRGAYRQAIFAIKHLLKYNFNPIITVTNYYNLSEEEIYEGFKKVFTHNNFDLDKSNIQINPYHDKNSPSENIIQPQNNKLDCMYGRILTTNGIYTCPFLANDYRGRCGSTFTDYNKKSSLETSFCNTCIKSKNQMFSIDFSKFE
jgi:MoaA/NifB/PqqE/SkfB family radical SAM enzyme